MRSPPLEKSRVSRLGVVSGDDGAAMVVLVARRRWMTVVNFMVVVGALVLIGVGKVGRCLAGVW